jgi:hypothetical protein
MMNPKIPTTSRLLSSEQTAPIDQRQLADETTKRRKELPLLQRIVQHSSKDRASSSTTSRGWRSAPLTNGVLNKFEIEHQGQSRMVCAVFKGPIQNLEGGLKAAFVGIGQPKNTDKHIQAY